MFNRLIWGSKGGDSHHSGPGSICGVEFAIESLLFSEQFFSGFPLLSKTNISKFQFDLERTDTFKRVHRNSKVLRGRTKCNFTFFIFGKKEPIHGNVVSTAVKNTINLSKSLVADRRHEWKCHHSVYEND